MLESILYTASAAIVLILGTIHLVYTFASNKFDPRDPAVAEQMRATSPVISRQTTMWRAWIGFNASHSLGAMLFGLVYGNLALIHTGVLARSLFLQLLGLLFLSSLLALARRYWFAIPFVGVLVSTILFAAGIAASLA